MWLFRILSFNFYEIKRKKINLNKLSHLIFFLGHRILFVMCGIKWNVNKTAKTHVYTEIPFGDIFPLHLCYLLSCDAMVISQHLFCSSK